MHYAFLVSEREFDEIFARIRERGLPYWSDPGHEHPNEINTWDDGRGVYWDDQPSSPRVARHDRSAHRSASRGSYRPLAIAECLGVSMRHRLPSGSPKWRVPS
jgi:hypothetical protein